MQSGFGWSFRSPALLSGLEKELSVPLNQESEMQRPHSTTNLSRFRPPPLQQPGGPLVGKGLQSKGVTSPLGKSAEGALSPFARVQVQPHLCAVQFMPAQYD